VRKRTKVFSQKNRVTEEWVGEHFAQLVGEAVSREQNWKKKGKRWMSDKKELSTGGIQDGGNQGF